MTNEVYQEALKNAAKTMVRVKNPNRLLKMIARFIVREVNLTHASVLINDPTRKRYVFVDSRGDKRIPTSLICLDHKNPLIEWFLTRNGHFKEDHLFYKDVESFIANPDFLKQEPDVRACLHNLRNAMSTLKIGLCVPGYYKGELLGVLLLGEKIDKSAFTKDEIYFFQTLAHDASMTIKNAHLREDLIQRNQELENKQKELKEKLTEIEFLRQKEQATYYQIVLSLAREVYAKDPYTSGHLVHVERLGLMTAQELGYDLKNEKKKNVLMASLHLHDVGKIGIPDNILKKPGPLTDEEWKVMKTHPVKGSKILEPLTEFRDVAKIVLHHHENYDGTGYPAGLIGTDIPIESRIIAVVDAFHAIVSNRCYRDGRPVEVAIKELEKATGTQFDPEVVQAFIRAYQKEMSKKAASSPELNHSS